MSWYYHVMALSPSHVMALSPSHVMVLSPSHVMASVPVSDDVVCTCMGYLQCGMYRYVVMDRHWETTNVNFGGEGDMSQG